MQLLNHVSHFVISPGEGSASSAMVNRTEKKNTAVQWLDWQQSERWLASVIRPQEKRERGLQSGETVKRSRNCWLLNHKQNRTGSGVFKCQTLRNEGHQHSKTSRETKRDSRGALFFGLCLWSNMRDMHKGCTQPTNVRPGRENAFDVINTV